MLGCLVQFLLLTFIVRPYYHNLLFVDDRRSSRWSASSAVVDKNIPFAEESLKLDLLQLATDTHRGFDATDQEREEIIRLISQLQKFDAVSSTTAGSRTTERLQGSWTLAYTDAPDITNLRPKNPTFGELGRIGQLCQAPYITNVIEWRRPSWATDLLPFTKERILQKVVTKAADTPLRPGFVTLKLSGLQVDAAYGGKNEQSRTRPIVTLDGPWTLPFGEFQLLYLDEELRITRTGQGNIAVNVRTKPHEKWF